jgi:hypothetical protein
MENDKLKLWLEVEKTNPEYTSEATISGRKITSIDAYSQFKVATEQFGSYGSFWGLKDTDLKLEKLDDDNTICIYKAIFFYPGGEFEIHNAILVKYKVASKGYIKVDDEFAKKIETNTVTKALSKLGFNTDVFMGKFEDSRYVTEVREEFKEEKMTEYKIKMQSAKNLKELSRIFSALPVEVKIEFENLKNVLKEKLTPKKNDNNNI